MTRSLRPDVVADVGAHHGEGPRWHEADRRLDWVDLIAGRLHRFDPETGTTETIDVGSPLGAFSARESGGFVLAVEDGFAFLNERSGVTELVARVDHGPGAAVRMNDGKSDPQGRFWSGSMSFGGERGRGALYRLDPDLTVTRMLGGCTISNGLDWSDDGRTMYFIDSGVPGVDAFDFDPDAGTIENRRRVVDVPDVADGPTGATAPDGMTLDADGFLWVAVWGSGEVRRFAPDGALEAVVEMPVACPTSVAFGGDDLSDLYITSMTPDRLGPDRYHPVNLWDRRAGEGALFRCRPGVRGRRPHAFAG